MGRKKLDVYIVYPRSRRHMGAVVMRAKQMREIYERYGTGTINVRLMAISTLPTATLQWLWVRSRPREAAYIFCKDAIDRISVEQRSYLSSHTRGVALDYIDKDLSSLDLRGISAHIAASGRQFQHLKSVAPGGGSVFLLRHQADFRLDNLDPPGERTSLPPVYFGEAQNLFIPEQFRHRIRVVNYTVKFTRKDIELLHAHGFHYGVRPAHQNVRQNIFKPATKIMNAAHLHSAVIVSRDTDDATELLGEDYPFLVDIASIESFGDVFSKVSQGFTSAHYKRAIGQMAHVRAAHSFRATALRFEEICQAM